MGKKKARTVQMANGGDVVTAAKNAINEVFSDTSVPPSATRDRLQELREEIDTMLESLPRAAAVLMALAVALGIAADARADTWISATTVSYHLDRSQHFNETNPGLGIEHGITENTAVVAGFYRNSISRESVYAGAAWTPLRAGYLRAGFVAGGITGYKISPAPMLVPAAMLEGKRFGANLLFVPHVMKDVPATFALQIKVKVD